MIERLNAPRWRPALPTPMGLPTRPLHWVQRGRELATACSVAVVNRLVAAAYRRPSPPAVFAPAAAGADDVELARLRLQSVAQAADEARRSASAALVATGRLW